MMTAVPLAISTVALNMRVSPPTTVDAVSPAVANFTVSSLMMEGGGHVAEKPCDEEDAVIVIWYLQSGQDHIPGQRDTPVISFTWASEQTVYEAAANPGIVTLTRLFTAMLPLAVNLMVMSAYWPGHDTDEPVFITRLVELRVPNTGKAAM